MLDNSRWSPAAERFVDGGPWEPLAGCFEEAAGDHGGADEQMIGVAHEQIGPSNLTWTRGALGLGLHPFALLCNELVRSQWAFLS